MKKVHIGLMVPIVVLAFCLGIQALERKERIIPNGRGGWPVIFEDESLMESEKDAIFEDYRSILSWLEPEGSYTVGKGDNQTIMMKCDAFLGLSDKAHWPAIADGKIGQLLIDENGTESALIPKSLSDAYKNALSVRDANIEAFSKLSPFVDRMTAMEPADLPSTMADAVYFAGVPQKFVEELSKAPQSRFVNEFGRYRYWEGSLLDCTEWKGHPVAVLRGFLRDRDGEGKSFDEVPVIYDEGKWKFVLSGGMF